MTEVDIEKHLEDAGLSPMQGESRKHKMSGNSNELKPCTTELSQYMEGMTELGGY